MNIVKNSEQIDNKTKISTLWIVIMFTMVFADILTFVLPEALDSMIKGTTGVNITQNLLLIMAVLVQIPIVMIFLSKILTYKINRILNIIAAIITILFVIGGGSLYLHYIFFATIEVICMVYIIFISWSWKELK